MKHIMLTFLVVFVALSGNAQKATNKKANKAKAATQAVQTTPAVIYDKAEILFDTLNHDFKEVFEGADAVHVFTFYNIGKEPLTISDAHPGCSCTVSDYTKEPVMPGKSGTVTVKYATKGRMGAFTKNVTVTSTSFKTPVVTLIIMGNVIAAPQEVH